MRTARRLIAFVLACCWAYGQQTADQIFERAVAAQRAGRWSEAEQSYRAYLKRFGPKPEVLANLGAVLVRQERFGDAISAYSRALKLAPDVLPIHLNLGLAYFKAGQLEGAVNQFTTVLDKQPGNAQARQLRAMCLLELERFEAAAQDYAALMPSQDVNVRLGLASAYLKLGRAQEAEQILESLFNTDAAEVKLLLGQVLIENGRLDEAKVALERAAELNPKLPTVYLNLGSVYWHKQETETALAQFRHELKTHPDSFEANYTLGAALAQSEEGRAEAEPLLRKAVALKPTNPLALYQLAKLVWQAGQGEEAAGLLERCVASDPHHRQAHYLLGTIYQMAGRKEEAQREFAAVRRITAQQAKRSEDLFERRQQ